MPNSYPLTAAQKELATILDSKSAEEHSKSLKDILFECIENCPLPYKHCVKHTQETRNLYRKTFLNVPPGSWATYRPPSYLNDISNLLDDDSVDLSIIDKRIAKEKRFHAKALNCTIDPYDHPDVIKCKERAAAMYDNNSFKEEEIKAVMLGTERHIQAKLTADQQAKQQRFLLCETDDEKYAFVENDACTPSYGDSIADAKMKQKWMELFATKKQYKEIIQIMKKDIEAANAEAALLRARIADIQMAEAGHITEKAKKKAAKQAHDQRPICSGSNCSNHCVGTPGKGPLECLQCKTEWNDLKRDSRTYFCSQNCVNIYGVEHRLQNHIGPVCSSPKCNKTCVGTVTHETPQCAKCKAEVLAGFRKSRSYFCSQDCVDRQGREHRRIAHPGVAQINLNPYGPW